MTQSHSPASREVFRSQSQGRLRRFVVVMGIGMLCCWSAPGRVRGANEAEEFHAMLDRLPIVEEVDTAVEAPNQEFPAQASVVTNLLGKAARVLPPGDAPKAMAYVLGAKGNLKPGATYVLSVEFPDDLPRACFIANRGSDQVRGFATGSATGDVRQQYTQPSLESLNYLQSGEWRRYRSLFVLHHRFQGIQAQRDPKPGGRPRVPADGFHVIIFQSRRINDARSQGAAVGRLRLHVVPDLAALFPKTDLPPEGLPRRHVFFREEMGDEPVSAAAEADRAMPDPLDWYVMKARVARALGFDTFGKDLLEFGFNQGWESGDQNWMMNAQPPLRDLWDRLAPRLADEGLELMPYYEYKGGIGLPGAKPKSLAWQHRAEKLYHGRPSTNYTGVWWTEGHNADLTDPDTLADAKRVLDRTVLAHKGAARFAGVWFRMRDNHLPISFSDATLARYNVARPGGGSEPGLKRDDLIASYEGDRKLYEQYVGWWLEQRVGFLKALQAYVTAGLGRPCSLLFTPWAGEPVPLLRDPRSGAPGHPVQITTDDPAWWETLARAQTNSSWFRWALVPKTFEAVVSGDDYSKSLRFREGVSQAPERREPFHSAPGADPENYRRAGAVSVTYPIGRLFTVARSDTLEAYRGEAGLTVVRHYPLNEDNPRDKSSPGPFGGLVGYVCVDVNRYGPYETIMEARAVANGDPVNIGHLSGSSFGSGSPGYRRQFHQAFLSVPALPSVRLEGVTSDPEVVVREVVTPKQGTWYYVVNTSMAAKRAVTVRLSASGKRRDLVAGKELGAGVLTLALDPGELRSYHVR